MQEMIFAVSNVKCGGCAENIKGGVEGLQGVSQVSVDVDSGEVKVQGDALDRELLVSKLAALGFPVVSS